MPMPTRIASAKPRSRPIDLCRRWRVIYRALKRPLGPCTRAMGRFLTDGSPIGPKIFAGMRVSWPPPRCRLPPRRLGRSHDLVVSGVSRNRLEFCGEFIRRDKARARSLSARIGDGRATRSMRKKRQPIASHDTSHDTRYASSNPRLFGRTTPDRLRSGSRPVPLVNWATNEAGRAD